MDRFIDRFSRLPSLLVVVVFVIVVVVQLGCVLGAMAAPGAEPYRSITAYLLSGFALGVWLAVLAFVAAAFLMLPLAVATVSRESIMRLVRAILLTSVLMLPMTAIWGASHAISHVPRVTFGLIEGKPDWSLSPAFGIIGSRWMLVFIVAFTILTTVCAWKRLRRLDARRIGPRCAACEYVLIGCVSPVCPECGAAIPAHLRSVKL